MKWLPIILLACSGNGPLSDWDDIEYHEGKPCDEGKKISEVTRKCERLSYTTTSDNYCAEYAYRTRYYDCRDGKWFDVTVGDGGKPKGWVER